LVNSFRLPIHAGTKELEQRSQHLKKSRHVTRKKSFIWSQCNFSAHIVIC